jgi:4-amino-4-deoxy-L-arabinose transferase-like glycosyltransferase
MAFYVLAGLFGHDPWKTEDVIHLAIARDFLEGTSLGLSLTPSPKPLYYWSAALAGRLLSGFLPLHDAMRLASGLWTALALFALHHAARECYGKESAAASPLLLAGSLGLLIQAHEAQPLLTLLAAISLALLAITCLSRKPRAALLWTGLALLIAGLGSGVSGLILLVLLLTFLLSRLSLPLPLPFAIRFLQGGLTVLYVLLLIVFLIPFAFIIALGATGNGPVAWDLAWLPDWRAEGVFFAAGLVHYFRNLGDLLLMLPWFSWPLLPLAGWSLWIRRRQGRLADVFLPLRAVWLLLVLLPILFPASETMAMLLLPPLALLATPGALALRRGAANAFDWFSGMTFSVFAILLWIGWFAMVFGWPARLAERAVILEPGFVGRFEMPLFMLAFLATLWWIWNLAALPRSPYRSLVRWTTGLAIVWLLAASLWLPWIDYGKSYRGLAATLAENIPPADRTCVAVWHMGAAQRASLIYFERLTLAPLDATGETTCRWLITQAPSRAELTPPVSAGMAWRRIWEGQRPGDRRERFRLYGVVKK